MVYWKYEPPFPKLQHLRVCQQTYTTDNQDNRISSKAIGSCINTFSFCTNTRKAQMRWENWPLAMEQETVDQEQKKKPKNK